MRSRTASAAFWSGTCGEPPGSISEECQNRLSTCPPRRRCIRAAQRMIRGACQNGLGLRTPQKWNLSREAAGQARYQSWASAGCRGICVMGASSRGAPCHPVGIRRGKKVVRSAREMAQGADGAVHLDTGLGKQGTHAVLEVPAAHAEAGQGSALEFPPGIQQRGQTLAQQVARQFVRACGLAFVGGIQRRGRRRAPVVEMGPDLRAVMVAHLFQHTAAPASAKTVWAQNSVSGKPRSLLSGASLGRRETLETPQPLVA